MALTTMEQDLMPKNDNKLIALRIKELREIMNFSVSEMAEKTGVSEILYKVYESGSSDLPHSFLFKCAKAFGVEYDDLRIGQSARLSTYEVTRCGNGAVFANEDGIVLQNMASMFKKRLGTPYWTTYTYSEELQNQPINTSTHSGQEFDLVIHGSLKVQVGGHIEILNEGDSIFYDSSNPHGMIATGGKDCIFLAMVMADDEESQNMVIREKNIVPVPKFENLVCEKFIKVHEDSNGAPLDVTFKDAEKFNFSFDIIDELAAKKPDKLAMIHVDKEMKERRFTFKEMMEESAKTANYFASLGIKRGDKVMLVLKRRYQFWFSMLALQKIGAIAIPATTQLKAHDFSYRFQSANVSAIVATTEDGNCGEIEKAEREIGVCLNKILVGGERNGWNSFDRFYGFFPAEFKRESTSPCGDDPMLMFFTSGTTGYPKIAVHSYKYALGHYMTARYWHLVQENGVHFTMSETGWAKALWGKFFGQWLCEGAIFVYDFDRFDAEKVLPMFAKYNITTFCGPPTIYRMLIKQDLSKYDLSSIKHATSAGEALNPEVFKCFEEATGLHIAEGFGQSETTLCIGTLHGMPVKLGSMGKVVPGWDIVLLDDQGNEVGDGVTGEISVRTSEGSPKGLFLGYMDEEKTKEAWHDGYYHTGDLAWRDEDGYFWYVGRADDVIKSSGYRIGPFEVESSIMELPYVLECGVSAVPDEVRGQVVKASVVLVPGKEPSEDLKKEIQNYVKEHTAPYKYPRIVEFKESLPKTISG
ncbi:MAG: AMP-binding protein, partial [Sphaerochaetaceae bacterium]|nr:AMP-binding protein [Sphaerochaetaceae bacterium]